MVTINSTSQVITGGSSFALDVALASSAYRLARVQILGPHTSGGGVPRWREGASVHATRSTSEAMGHSIRDAGSYRSYVVTYAKASSATNLSHKIFDNVTGSGYRYIALQDAQIVGAVLRLTFRNYDGAPRTLWVKGEAMVF